MRKRRTPRSRLLVGIAILTGVAFVVARLDRGGRSGPAVVARIAEIQGAAHASPLVGREVRDVVGIVTAVLENGFFLQDPGGDDLDATSEAVFVFTPSGPDASVGDRVAVSGRVVEYYPGGRDSGNLSTTQIGWAEVHVVSSGHPLPPAIPLTASSPSGDQRALPREIVEDDAGGGPVDDHGVRFDPESDALDFFESLEGMRVRIDEADVVGSLSRFGEMVVVLSSRDPAGKRTRGGGILRSLDQANPDRLTFDDKITAGPPRANVGDRLEGGIGVIDYSFGSYKILNTEPLRLRRGSLEPGTTSLTGSERGLTVASYNVLNLHPGVRTRVNRIARQIVANLRSPDIVALQEMQDDSGKLNDDVVAADQTFGALVKAIVTSGGPRYAYRQIDPEDDQDGGEPGGNIRVGYLFRPERVSFVDPFDAPVLEATPEFRGRAFSEAGRIRSKAYATSRKPLLAQFRFAGQTVIVINVHQSSKYGSAPRFGRIQPPPDPTAKLREGQARVLRALVTRLLEADSRARVVVLGDFNDSDYSGSLKLLAGPLVNLTQRLSLEERYTYVYQGNSQALDHILVTRALADHAEYEVVHINAEFAGAASDHDPVVARFTFP